MSPIYIHSCPVYGRRQKMKRQNKKISKEEEETNNKKINMRSIIHSRCRLSFFISFFQKTRTAAWLFSCFLSDLWVMLGWHRSHILRLINLPPPSQLAMLYLWTFLPGSGRHVYYICEGISCAYMYVHMSTTQFNIAFPLSRLLLLLLRHSSFDGGLALVGLCIHAGYSRWDGVYGFSMR